MDSGESLSEAGYLVATLEASVSYITQVRVFFSRSFLHCNYVTRGGRGRRNTFVILIFDGASGKAIAADSVFICRT